MRLPIVLIILLSLSLVFSSCHDQVDPQFLSLQREMDSNPDSVLSVLGDMDSPTLRGRNRALHSLLTVQAQDKTNSLPDSSHRLDSAIDYFNRHGGDRERMMSAFYKARILFNRGDYEEAMQTLYPAYQLSLTVGDPYWIAKTAEGLADIFSHNYLFEDQLKFSRIAVENYREANQFGNYEYALCDYACCLINLGDYDKGKNICDSIFNVAVQSGDTALAEYSLDYRLDACLREKDIDEAGRLLETVRHSHIRDLNENTLITLIGLYRISNEPDSAFKYMRAVKEWNLGNSAKAGLLWEYEKYYISRGETDKALEMADSLFKLQNETVGHILRQTPIRAQSDYYSELARQREENNRLKTNIIFIIIGFSFICIWILYKYYWIRIKAKDQEIEMKLNDIQLLHQEITLLIEKEKTNSNKNSLLMRELEEIFYSQFATIGQLAKEYYERGEVKSARQAILTTIEDKINEWKRTDKAREIEYAINLHTNDAIKRLREQVPNLKEEDITFITYLWSGLPSKAVALFCGIQIKTFYSKRTRLIEKLKKSDAPDKEEFIRKTST